MRQQIGLVAENPDIMEYAPPIVFVQHGGSFPDKLIQPASATKWKGSNIVADSPAKLPDWQRVTPGKNYTVSHN